MDAELWTRISSLDETALQNAVGAWLSRSQIKSMLARRDKMAAVIGGLVQKNGRRAVFVW